jgi:hypothetical protein
MDSFCSFFVHVRLRSFRSMTSFFCPMSGSGLSDLWSVRISVRLFCVPFKGKKIRWPSLSFFRSCPAPVFPIYAPPPPTPSVPFYLYCICEGGGGRGQGGPWPMGDSGSCSGVLKYAVTWYCISTFTSLHISAGDWEPGMGSVCVWPDFALPPFSSPLWPLGNCNQTPGPQPRCTS